MVEFLVTNVKMVCEHSKRYPEDKGLKLNDISNLRIFIYIYYYYFDEYQKIR